MIDTRYGLNIAMSRIVCAVVTASIPRRPFFLSVGRGDRVRLCCGPGHSPDIHIVGGNPIKNAVLKDNYGGGDDVHIK